MIMYNKNNMSGIGEIVAIVLGSMAAAKAVQVVSKKIKFKLKYKSSKKSIYKSIKKSLKAEDGKLLHAAIQKLKEFDIEHESDKLERLLGKLGIPDDVIDTVDSISHYLEEAKDTIIEAIESEPEILKIVDEKVSL